MTTAFRGHGLPPRADPGEKALGGLVGGALRDELAAAGALAHRAAERGGAARRPFDRGAEHVDRRELLTTLERNSVAFGEVPRMRVLECRARICAEQHDLEVLMVGPVPVFPLELGVRMQSLLHIGPERREAVEPSGANVVDQQEVVDRHRHSSLVVKYRRTRSRSVAKSASSL